jgi:hypothetical protein
VSRFAWALVGALVWWLVQSRDDFEDRLEAPEAEADERG